MPWLRKKREASDVSAGLRSELFHLDPASVGLEPSADFPNVWGGLMEMAYPEEAATIVSLADGTTSMYTTGGGGVIGGGAHEPVVETSRRFLARIEQFLDRLDSEDEQDLPPPGFVAFRALTYNGVRAAAAAEEELGSGTHQLSPLFAAGHEVVTALREATVAGR